MRAELLYNPFLLLERLGEWAVTSRRLARLKGSVAANLQPGHIDSLELLDLLRSVNPKVIGANIGTWTLLAKAIFPSAHVHAFEPLSSHTKTFETYVRELPNVELHQIALGSENSHTMLHVTDFSEPFDSYGRRPRAVPSFGSATSHC